MKIHHIANCLILISMNDIRVPENINIIKFTICLISYCIYPSIILKDLLFSILLFLKIEHFRL